MFPAIGYNPAMTSDHKRNAWRWIVGSRILHVAIPVAAIGWVCLGWWFSLSAPLPAPSDILAIRVNWEETCDGQKPPVKEFRITSGFEKILDALRPNRYDPNPNKMVIAGRFTFEMKDGSVIDLRLFWPESDPASFETGEAYYRGGSMCDLDKLLHELAAIP